MKLTSLYVVLFALCSLIACSEDKGSEIDQTGEEASLSLQIRVPQIGSKAGVGTVDVKRLFVAIFDGGGALLTTREVADNGGVSTIENITPLPEGDIQLFLIANAPAGTFNDMNKIDEFLATTHQLQNEQEGQFTLSTGIANYTLRKGLNSIGTGNGNILSSNPMTLYRNVAAVSLSKIIMNPSENFANNASFTLKSVFMANVKDLTYYMSETNWGAVEVMNNIRFFCGQENLIDKEGELKKGSAVYDASFCHLYDGTSLTPGNEITSVSDPFYVYENMREEANRTLLIIRGDYTYTNDQGVPVTITDGYYTVVVNRQHSSISGVEEHLYVKRNVMYTIDVILKGPGKLDPFNPSDNSTLTVAVTVAAWGKVVESPVID